MGKLVNVDLDRDQYRGVARPAWLGVMGAEGYTLCDAVCRSRQLGQPLTRKPRGAETIAADFLAFKPSSISAAAGPQRAELVCLIDATHWTQMVPSASAGQYAVSTLSLARQNSGRSHTLAAGLRAGVFWHKEQNLSRHTAGLCSFKGSNAVSQGMFIRRSRCMTPPHLCVPWSCHVHSLSHVCHDAAPKHT